MSGDEWMALLLSLVPVVVLWRGFRPVDETYLRRWSDRFGPTLDDETRPRIAAALRRGRRLRAVGAAVGVPIAALPAYLNLVAPERAGDFAGLSVAAVAAGLCLAAGLWRIVRRPRLSLEPRWRIVDEALRADGANRLAGAAVAVSAIAASVTVGEVFWDLFPPLGFVAGMASSAALGWWWFLTSDVIWRVDRLHAPA